MGHPPPLCGFPRPRESNTPLIMRTSTALLAALLLALGGLTAWLLWERAPPPAPTKAAPVTEGGGLAAVAPLPGLDEVARPEPAHNPHLAAAFENAPARLAVRAAMAVEGERRLVVDVASLKATAPGQAAMRCMMRRSGDELDRMKERSGFEPFEQIDEMAVVDGMAVARGRLGDVKWAQMHPSGEDIEPEPYGEQGQLYMRGNRGVATWGEEILLGDGGREELMAAIDRIEGRAEGAQVPGLGGTSGLLPAEDLFEVVPVPYELRESLEAWFREHKTGLGFAVQATDAGVQITARFNGDAQTVKLLSEAFEALKEGTGQDGRLGDDEAGPRPDPFRGLLKNLTHSPIEGGIEATLVAPLAAVLEVMGPCASEDGEEVPDSP